MADERYEWLDRKAAERLLRGEPVETRDEHARAQAARLSRALNDTGAAGGHDRAADGEMPGEAAALAAFRKARAAAAPAGDSVGTVRLVSSPPPTLGTRLARPMRFGLVAAVAGCALGGVAVAAGSGLLPSPFGGNPLPASTVSAAETPEPLASQESPTDGEALSPSRGPSPSGTSQVSPSPGASNGTYPGPSAGSGDGDSAGGTDKHRGDVGDMTADRDQLYRKTAEACRDYQSGRIDPERKRRLERAAKGSARVERFCDRLLSDDFNGSGDDGGSGDGDDGDSDGASGGSGGGAKPPGDFHQHGASLPPVSWNPLPAEVPPLPSESSSPSSGHASIGTF